jgi:hypothetical protein
LKQAGQFTWKQMADQIADVLVAATLLPITSQLRAINLAVCPDWSVTEEEVFAQIASALRQLERTLPALDTALCIVGDTEIEEQATRLLTYLLWAEGFNLDALPALVPIPRLEARQWRILCHKLHYRLPIEPENFICPCLNLLPYPELQEGVLTLQTASRRPPYDSR